MHIIKLKKFYFINKLNFKNLNKLNKNVSIIYREYSRNIDEKEIIKIKKICKKQKREFFISNQIKLALKLSLDGVYLPSFNKSLKHKIYGLKKNFKIIGSAHNIREIREKELQGVKVIFLAPLFEKDEKKWLGISKFNLLSNQTNQKLVALGGISKQNLKKLHLLKIFGFAGISFFE
tara:strand:+ start:115 stop:645 length:531 start_codon:yes stop_codon:yes gene_type:complete